MQPLSPPPAAKHSFTSITTQRVTSIAIRRCQTHLRRCKPPQTFVHPGTPGDTSSHPTPFVADSTSPIFCSREEISERTMNFVDPSINEEVDDIENTDTIATDDDVQKPKRAKTSQVWKQFEESKAQDGLIQLFCKHCKHVFKMPSTSATSHLGRHLKSCPVKLRVDALEERERA